MGKEPLKENTNVYFQARKRAAMSNDRLFSRENAAELLGISPYTLADYELGNTKVVPVDKVVLMAIFLPQTRITTLKSTLPKPCSALTEIIKRVRTSRATITVMMNQRRSSQCLECQVT